MTNSSLSTSLLTAASTGICTSSVVLLGYTMLNNSRPDIIVGWREIWFMGSFGAMLGAHVSVMGRSWFTPRH